MRQLAQILVPVDFSACSDEALRAAAALAGAFEGRLIVVHFVPIDLYAVGDFPAVTVDGERLERERDRVDAHVDAILGSGDAPPYEVEVAWGSPHVDIVHYAVERRVDLIVVGTHGRTGMKHVLLGSVAERTVRTAPCPVLTVRAGTASALREMHAVDRPPAGRPREGEVGRMMTCAPLVVASTDMLEVARQRMVRAGIRHLPVVDGGRLVGILSDRDLPAHVGQFARTKVDAAMTPNPIAVSRDVSAESAARLMIEHRVRALPVVDGERVVGILSATDILEDYIRAARP